MGKYFSLSFILKMTKCSSIFFEVFLFLPTAYVFRGDVAADVYIGLLPDIDSSGHLHLIVPLFISF